MSERAPARPDRLPSAEIVLRGLDALEVALAVTDETAAAEAACSMLAGLDEDALRRVGAWLAVKAARLLVRKDAAAVRRALEGTRLEAIAELPQPSHGAGTGGHA